MSFRASVSLSRDCHWLPQGQSKVQLRKHQWKQVGKHDVPFKCCMAWAHHSQYGAAKRVEFPAGLKTPCVQRSRCSFLMRITVLWHICDVCTHTKMAEKSSLLLYAFLTVGQTELQSLCSQRPRAEPALCRDSTSSPLPPALSPKLTRGSQWWLFPAEACLAQAQPLGMWLDSWDNTMICLWRWCLQ